MMARILISMIQSMPIRLTQVDTLTGNSGQWGGFDSMLKIAARVESLTYRNFYESALTHTNPVEPDEPVLTG